MARGTRHKRTLVAAVVALVAMVAAVSVYSTAEAQLDEFTLSVDSATGPIGETVTVDVVLSFDPVEVALAPAALEATFLWDSNELQVTDCTPLIGLGWCAVDDDEARLAVVDPSELGFGQLAIARLTVVPQTIGSGLIEVADVVNYDMAGVSLQAETVDGQITGVADEPSPVSGDVDCSGDMTIVDALLIAQWSVSTRADSQGCPLFVPSAQLHVSEGDLDQDGATTIVDALLIAQCIVGARVIITCPENDA